MLVRAARVYDAVQPFVTLGQENRLNRWLAQQLQLPERGRVLDIGCGTGLLTWEIARHHPSCAVAGIDASLPMVEVARRKRSLPNCEYHQAVAESLPFENETFHAATSALFFHHVNREYKLRGLREAWRVLKPGGSFYIADIGRPYTALGWAMAGAGWLLLRQPEIKENMDGILPGLIREAGFSDLSEIGRWSGYITAIVARKPCP